MRNHEHFENQAITQERPGLLRGKVSDFSSLHSMVDYLSTCWRQEGLPEDWENLGGNVGFSMNKQMNLLKGLSTGERDLWTTRTEMDLRGFTLEYLSDSCNVYPYAYICTSSSDGREQLWNMRYGKDITDTASRNERSGAVVETLERIKQFMCSDKTIDGSLAVMVSPQGATGMTTDDGEEIVYETSYLYVFKKQGVEVNGFAVQTDCKATECREIIQTLTGRLLRENSGGEEIVRSVVLLAPLINKTGVRDEKDILHQIEKIMGEKRRSSYAYKNIRWNNVQSYVKNQHTLYQFDLETEEILKQFRRYMSEGKYTESVLWNGCKEMQEIKKALAATVIRLTRKIEEKLRETSGSNTTAEEETFGGQTGESVADGTRRAEESYGGQERRLGDTLVYLQSRQGCAGGGDGDALRHGEQTNRMVVQSVTERIAMTRGADIAMGMCVEIRCKSCGWSASDVQAKDVVSGKLIACPECGWKP